ELTTAHTEGAAVFDDDSFDLTAAERERDLGPDSRGAVLGSTLRHPWDSITRVGDRPSRAAGRRLPCRKTEQDRCRLPATTEPRPDAGSGRPPPRSSLGGR